MAVNVLKCPLIHALIAAQKYRPSLNITRNSISNQHITVESRLSDLNGKVKLSDYRKYRIMRIFIAKLD